MSKYLTKKNLLLGILALAFLLRFWGAGDRDFFGDEGVDAFRGVGFVDYLGTSFQTQPIDWYKDTVMPWWTKLSFHDFPPLAMAIQHAFFSFFGDSILVARLPAIMLGTLSTLLIYLIVRRFLEEKIALLAAFLFSINSVMVWIFRTSILEPILLFFILLNIYWFFRFSEDRRYWWLFGATLGLVALTKYTSVFILPVYLAYLAYHSYGSDKFDKSNKPYMSGKSDESYKSENLDKSDETYKTNKTYKSYLSDWRLYAALGLAILLFSPVLVYNFYLYQATGHFDLQFAYLLGQETPEWTGLVGKVQAPFFQIWENLTTGAREADGTFSPVVSYQVPFLFSALIGFLCLIFRFMKFFRSAERAKERKFTVFLFLYLIFATLLFVKIGSAHRFLALYGPVLVIFSAVAVNWLLAKPRKAGSPDQPQTIDSGVKSFVLKFLACAFLIWEICYSINRNFIQAPDYGIAKLDNFFEQEFVGKESAVIPESDNPHLNEIIKKFAGNKKNGDRVASVIVYNDNVELPILDWIFYRRFFYHGIPTLFVENFNKAVSAQGEDYFRNFTVYFVQSTENTILNQFKKEKTAGLEFEARLQGMGLSPVKIIYGHGNLQMFRVYKFSL